VHDSSRIPAFFRRIALKGWKKSAYFTYSSSYPVMRRWLIAQLSTRDKAILSIGCGSGELERDLIKLNRKVTGLDICYEMLQSAWRRGVKNVVQADALKLPFASSAFDLVMFPESIGYFELDEVLPGVRQVLKKRGRLLITAYPTNFAADNNYRKFTVQGLTLGLEGVGFRIADLKLLTIKRSRVTEVFAEERSEMIYVLARK
jgi:SAM-dependent methyltransferase